MINTRISTQIIGPIYQFTDECSLVEGAKRIMELGSDIIKFTLSP